MLQVSGKRIFIYSRKKSFNLDASTPEILGLKQLDKVLYKWFTAMPFRVKPVTGPLIIPRTNCFFDEMKVTCKCTFCDSWQ